VFSKFCKYWGGGYENKKVTGGVPVEPAISTLEMLCVKIFRYVLFRSLTLHCVRAHYEFQNTCI
jgi:hypothetical protein